MMRRQIRLLVDEDELRSIVAKIPLEMPMARAFERLKAKAHRAIRTLEDEYGQAT